MEFWDEWDEEDDDEDRDEDPHEKDEDLEDQRAKAKEAEYHEDLKRQLDFEASQEESTNSEQEQFPEEPVEEFPDFDPSDHETQEDPPDDLELPDEVENLDEAVEQNLQDLEMDGDSLGDTIEQRLENLDSVDELSEDSPEFEEVHDLNDVLEQSLENLEGHDDSLGNSIEQSIQDLETVEHLNEELPEYTKEDLNDAIEQKIEDLEIGTDFDEKIPRDGLSEAIERNLEELELENAPSNERLEDKLEELNKDEPNELEEPLESPDLEQAREEAEQLFEDEELEKRHEQLGKDIDELKAHLEQRSELDRRLHDLEKSLNDWKESRHELQENKMQDAGNPEKLEPQDFNTEEKEGIKDQYSDLTDPHREGLPKGAMNGTVELQIEREIDIAAEVEKLGNSIRNLMMEMKMYFLEEELKKLREAHRELQQVEIPQKTSVELLKDLGTIQDSSTVRSLSDLVEKIPGNIQSEINSSNIVQESHPLYETRETTEKFFGVLERVRHAVKDLPIQHFTLSPDIKILDTTRSKEILHVQERSHLEGVQADSSPEIRESLPEPHEEPLERIEIQRTAILEKAIEITLRAREMVKTGVMDFINVNEPVPLEKFKGHRIIFRELLEESRIWVERGTNFVRSLERPVQLEPTTTDSTPNDEGLKNEESVDLKDHLQKEKEEMVPSSKFHKNETSSKMVLEAPHYSPEIISGMKFLLSNEFQVVAQEYSSQTGKQIMKLLRFTKDFKNWCIQKKNFSDRIKKHLNSLFRHIKEIIAYTAKGLIIFTDYSLVKISEYFPKFGLKVSRNTITNIARVFLENNFAKRFPKSGSKKIQYHSKRKEKHSEKNTSEKTQDLLLLKRVALKYQEITGEKPNRGTKLRKGFRIWVENQYQNYEDISEDVIQKLLELIDNFNTNRVLEGFIILRLKEGKKALQIRDKLLNSGFEVSISAIHAISRKHANTSSKVQFAEGVIECVQLLLSSEFQDYLRDYCEFSGELVIFKLNFTEKFKERLFKNEKITNKRTQTLNYLFKHSKKIITYMIQGLIIFTDISLTNITDFFSEMGLKFSLGYTKNVAANLLSPTEYAARFPASFEKEFSEEEQNYVKGLIILTRKSLGGITRFLKNYKMKKIEIELQDVIKIAKNFLKYKYMRRFRSKEFFKPLPEKTRTHIGHLCILTDMSLTKISEFLGKHGIEASRGAISNVARDLLGDKYKKRFYNYKKISKRAKGGLIGQLIFTSNSLTKIAKILTEKGYRFSRHYLKKIAKNILKGNYERRFPPIFISEETNRDLTAQVLFTRKNLSDITRYLNEVRKRRIAIETVRTHAQKILVASYKKKFGFPYIPESVKRELLSYILFTSKSIKETFETINEKEVKIKSTSTIRYHARKFLKNEYRKRFPSDFLGILGDIVHFYFENLLGSSMKNRNVKVLTETGVNQDADTRPDNVIEVDISFRKAFPQLSIPAGIKYLAIDYSIDTSQKNFSDKCFREYQTADSIFFFVPISLNKKSSDYSVPITAPLKENIRVLPITEFIQMFELDEMITSDFMEIFNKTRRRQSKRWLVILKDFSEDFCRKKFNYEI